MKKTLLFFVLGLLIANYSFSQVRVGLTAEVGASNFIEDDDFFNENRYGFLGGLVFDLGLTKNFSIVPEVLYIQKGAAATEKDNPNNNGNDYYKSTNGSLAISAGIIFKIFI